MRSATTTASPDPSFSGGRKRASPPVDEGWQKGDAATHDGFFECRRHPETEPVFERSDTT